MVEVFKTNVNDPASATLLLDQIHRQFPAYHANFDLEDCDRILRVASHTEINASALIIFLNTLDIHISMLPDELLSKTPPNEN